MSLLTKKFIGYVLCQALMITFMNLRNIDPQISDDAMHDMEHFANQYRRLEAYITEVLYIWWGWK